MTIQVDFETIDILLRWLRNAKRVQKGHYAAANHFTRLNHWFGIPAVIISSLVGTGVFVSIGDDVSTIWKIIAGMMSVFAAVLAALQTWLSYQDRAARHHSSAKAYGSIKREIEQILVFVKAGKLDPLSSMDELRKRLEILAEKGPLIPNRYIEEMEQIIPPTPIEAYYSSKSNDIE